jgi:hypothetical protein
MMALNSWENGRYNTIRRFLDNGRQICFTDDFTAPGNAGPLWVKQTMRIKDDTENKCLEVASLVEGPTSVSSHIFPGIHYCKLISPARIVDFIMTDSLKESSGCLNTPSSIVEVLL